MLGVQLASDRIGIGEYGEMSRITSVREFVPAGRLSEPDRGTLRNFAPRAVRPCAQHLGRCWRHRSASA